MKKDNSTIIVCPNCGRIYELSSAKGPGWDTLDGFQAIIATITPMFFGLVVVIALRMVEKLWDFTPSVWFLYAAFIGTAAATFPVMVHIMVSHQKRLLEGQGVNLFRIACTCRPENTFTIIRPITTTVEQAETVVEYPFEFSDDQCQ